MRDTPASRNRNAPVPELKSIEPQHEVALRINNNATGSALAQLLMGVIAFTKSFSETDEYEVGIQLKKVLPAKDEPKLDA